MAPDRDTANSSLFSDRPWDRMEGRYTRPVPPEEQAAIERIADKLVPLCSIPRCEKLAGHTDDHGPSRLFGESA